MKNFFFRSKGNPPKGSGLPPSPTEGVEDSIITGDELRDRKNVKLLLEAIGGVSSTLSLDSLLVDIVDKSIELTRAERGLLLLDVSGQIEIEVARDAKKRRLPAPIQYSTTLVHQVAQTRRPLRRTVSSDAEAAELGRSVFDLKLRAVMCAPLVAKDRLIGVVYVDTRAAEREFSRADLSFFHALSRQLAIAIENARLVADSVEKARLAKEIQIAGEIQKGLLPEGSPEFPGVDLFGWYSPCEEATGDSYDFFPLGENRVALILVDVSGHGVGPALLSATARAALRAYLQVVPDLGKVADLLGQDLQRDMKPGMFMTLFLGHYDVGEKTLDYINAGHPSPVLVQKGKAARLLEEFEPAFGFREQLQAKTTRIHLQPGDLLVVYSDGLIEARSFSGELYGVERLQKIVDQMRNRPAQEVIEGIIQNVLSFTVEKRDDDWTLFALRVP